MVPPLTQRATRVDVMFFVCRCISAKQRFHLNRLQSRLTRETARPFRRRAACVAVMAGAACIFSLPNLLSAFVLLLGLFGCSASQPPRATSTPAPSPAPVAAASVGVTPQRPLFTPPPEVASDSPI